MNLTPRSRPDFANMMYLLLRLDEQKKNRESLATERVALTRQREEALQIRKDTQTEKETGRVFANITGLKLDPESEQYSRPLRNEISKLGTMENPSQLQSVQGGNQSINKDLLQYLPPGQSGTNFNRPMTLSDVPDSPAARETQSLLKSDREQQINAMGLDDPASPAFDAELTKRLRTGLPTLPSKIPQEQEKMVKLRGERGEAASKTAKGIVDTASIDADKRLRAIAPEQAQSTLEGQNLTNQFNDETMVDRVAKATADRQLTEGQVAAQPQEAEARQEQINTSLLNQKKTTAEMARAAENDRLARAYATASPQDQKNIVTQMAVNNGHGHTVFFEDQKMQDLAVTMQDKATKDLSAAMTLAKDDPFNVKAIQDAVSGHNTASIRAATHFGSDKVTLAVVQLQNSVKPWASMAGGSKQYATVATVNVSRSFALAYAQGKVDALLNQPIPVGATPQQAAGFTEAKARFLGYKVLADNPDTQGNPELYVKKIAELLGVDPALKKKALEYMLPEVKEAPAAVDAGSGVKLKGSANLPTDIGRSPSDAEAEAGAAKLPGVAAEKIRREEFGKKTAAARASTIDIAAEAAKRGKLPTQLTDQDIKDIKSTKKGATLSGVKDVAPSLPTVVPVEKSPMVQKTLKDAQEIFATNQRFSSARASTFEQWLAEQGHRLNRPPSSFAVSELGSFYTLWQNAKH